MAPSLSSPTSVPVRGVDPAPGEEAGEDIAPVMSTRGEDLSGRILAADGNRGDVGRPTHLAAHDYESFVEQSANGQVVEESAEAIVDGR